MPQANATTAATDHPAAVNAAHSSAIRASTPETSQETPLGTHDSHLPRRNHNKMVESKTVSTSAAERKEVAAHQGWGTKQDAKNAKQAK